MPSCDTRLPLDTWNLPESKENVLGNPRPMFDSSQTLYQGILHSTKPSATGEVPVHMSAGALVAREEERIGSTIPMPAFASSPSTMSSLMLVDFRVLWLDCKDSRYRNFNWTNSQIPHHFYAGR